MTDRPYTDEDLRAEAARQQQTESAPRWTPEEQARHRAELEAALSSRRRPQEGSAA